MMTPEAARNLLGEAHKRMSPPEIAEHALSLAEAAAAQAQVIADALRTLEAIQRSLDGAEAFAGEVIVAVRNADHLFRRRKKADAREVIRQISAAERGRIDTAELARHIEALRVAAALPLPLRPSGNGPAPAVDGSDLEAGRRDRRAAPQSLHCIAGSFGVGYQSQNPWLGGAGGALSGLGAGASIASTMGAGATFLGMAAAVAVPVVGAIAGPPVGEVGPIPLGENDDGKEASEG